MIRGMFSAISGLRNHQIMLDVTANNLANVNTVGFKSSRASFKDQLQQTYQFGTAAAVNEFRKPPSRMREPGSFSARPLSDSRDSAIASALPSFRSATPSSTPLMTMNVASFDAARAARDVAVPSTIAIRMPGLLASAIVFTGASGITR